MARLTAFARFDLDFARFHLIRSLEMVLAGLRENIQYMSASIAASSVDFFFSNMRHSQSGYSWSSMASGSDLPLMKFRPFKGMPAGTDDITTGD